MRCSSHKGFMLLVPILVMSAATLSLAYVLMYRVGSLRYTVGRHEKHLEEKYERESCENLGVLYLSYDPDFVIDC